MSWTLGLGPLLAVGRLVKDAAVFGIAEGKRRREDQAWAPLRQNVEWRIATAIGTMYVQLRPASRGRVRRMAAAPAGSSLKGRAAG